MTSLNEEQVIALKKIPQEKRKDKPIRIPLPHPIYSIDGQEICLIVKDRKGEGHKAAKLKVREEKVAGVSKVVGVSKLRTKYESHESKRQLCSSFDLFLADERVLPTLPKLLGKAFFRKKKQPVPVRLTGKDWGAQVAAACGATYLVLGGGSSLSLKGRALRVLGWVGARARAGNARVAKSSQSEQQCVENVVAAAKAAVERLPKKWAGIKSVFLKSSSSVALPIYQAAPEQANQE
ncbi:hypothetical protein N2152v2_008105 [Parachlorella kessleri]